jgi:hypothetical protein
VLPKQWEGDTKTVGAHKRYKKLIYDLQQRNSTTDGVGATGTQSPLAELLVQLEAQWQRIEQSASHEAFITWLERTVPIHEQAVKQKNKQDDSAVEMLDSLDAVLLATVVELEQAANEQLSLDALEEKLQQIWRRSYAYYASQQEQQLQTLFVRRGMALRETIYPDRAHRRRLYRTGLPPISGTHLLLVYSNLLDHLKTGSEYVGWSDEQKMAYIAEVVHRVGNVPQFRLAEKAGRSKVDWYYVLRWWLDPRGAIDHPTNKQVSSWHDYVSINFHYRFNWGLGALVALAIDEAYQGEQRSPSLEDWPQTQLPWIVFWLKELIIWGTLDPVAAYLLSRKLEVTRKNAENTVQEYYRIYASTDPNEVLNASKIREWAEGLSRSRDSRREERWSLHVNVELLRDFIRQSQPQWRVIPIETDTHIIWSDPAGFPLARSSKFDGWKPDDFHEYDFLLDAPRQVVTSRSFMM